jgi:hypothetical protein
MNWRSRSAQKWVEPTRRANARPMINSAIPIDCYRWVDGFRKGLNHMLNRLRSDNLSQFVYDPSPTFGKSLTRTNPSWLVNVSVWSALCAWATPKMRWLPVS